MSDWKMPDRSVLSRRELVKLVSTTGLGSLAGCGGQRIANETPDSISLRWSQLPGPPGGPVTYISVSEANPDWIYSAGRTAGIHVTSSGGSEWIQGFSGQHHRSRVWVSPHNPKTAFTHREWTDNGGRKWNHPEWSNRERYAPAAAPATSLGGPTVARAYNIEWDPFREQTIYASTPEGLYLTANGGRSWERTPIDETDLPPHFRGWDFAIHPNQEGLIVAGLGNKVARSTNRGETWSIRDLGEDYPQTRGLYIRGVEFADEDSDAIYLAIERDSVYKLEDGSLVDLAPKLSHLVFPKYDLPISISANGRKMYFIAGQSDEMYPVRQWWLDRSLYEFDVDGNGLDIVTTPVKPNAVANHPNDESTLFIGGNSWVHQTTDDGQTWKALRNGFVDHYLATVAVNPSQPGTVFPGSMCSTGLSVSYDQGQTYQWKRSGLNTWHRGDFSEHYVMQIAAKQERAYATTEAGLLISEDNGQNWEMLETDFSGQGEWDEPVTHLHGLAVHPTDPDVVYVGTGRGGHGPEEDAFEEAKIWKSTDGGQSWRLRTDGFPSGTDTTISDIIVNPREPETVYLATNRVDRPPEGAEWENADGVGLYMSTNGGRTWDNLSAPFESAYALTVDAGDTETVYASTPTPEGYPPEDPEQGGGAYRSRDNGDNWEQILPYETHGLRAHPAEPNLLFAGAQKYRNYWEVLVSRDGGDTWAEGNLRVRAYIEGDGPEKSYDATELHSDYWGDSSGQIMWFAIDETNSLLYAATNGVGLWQAEIDNL